MGRHGSKGGGGVRQIQLLIKRKQGTFHKSGKSTQQQLIIHLEAAKSLISPSWLLPADRVQRHQPGNSSRHDRCKAAKLRQRVQNEVIEVRQGRSRSRFQQAQSQETYMAGRLVNS